MISDLKLITDRMIEKKKVEIQNKIQQAELEAKNRLAAADTDLAEEEVKQKKMIDVRLANEFEKNKNSLVNHKRDQLLSEKQLSLNSVFEKALMEMEQWNETEFQAFLLSVLKEFKAMERVELILGEKSAEKVSQQWIEEVASKELNVSLSNETIAGKFGFILRDNGIQYNYLFHALINESKNHLIPSVSKKLFQ